MVSAKDLVNPTFPVENDAARPGFVIHLHKAFENVTQRPMAHIVKQCGTSRGKTHSLGNRLFASELVEDSRGNPHRADRMTEAGMLSPMVGQVCKSHLADMPQPLHFRSVNELHQRQVFRTVFVQRD